MKTKTLVGITMIVLVYAVFVAADGYLKTHAGDIILDPAGGVVNLNGSNLSGVNYINAGQTLHIGVPSDVVYLTGLTVSDKLINGKDDSGLAFYAEACSTCATGQPMDFYVRNTSGSGSWKRVIRINAGDFSTEKSVEITYETLYLSGNDIKGVGSVTPLSFNASDLGSSPLKWRNIYYNGSLITSSVGYRVPGNNSAVKILSGMRTEDDGQLDHKSIDESLLVREVDYSQEYYRQLHAIKMELAGLGDESRNLTADDIAVKRGYTAYLNNETQEYELIDVSKLIVAQQEAIKELRSELCKKDNTYKFC